MRRGKLRLKKVMRRQALLPQSRSKYEKVSPSNIKHPCNSSYLEMQMLHACRNTEGDGFSKSAMCTSFDQKRKVHSLPWGMGLKSEAY
jgi:hypothetical protein